MIKSISNSLRIKTQHIKTGLCLLIIITFFISFIYNGIIRGTYIPNDFRMIYSNGLLWRNGGNIYDPNQVCSGSIFLLWCDNPYLPVGNAFFSFFSYFDLINSYFVFRVVNLLLLFVNITILGYFIKRYWKLGWFEFILLASFLNTGFSRLNMRNGQIGIILCTLLFSTLFLIHRGKVYLSSLGLAGTLIKPTFYPIFIIYCFIHKKWKILLTGMLISGLLLLLPCLLTGRPILSTYQEWIGSVGVNQTTIINDPSPNSALSAELVYLLPLTNRIFNSQSLFIMIANYIILIAAWGFSLVKIASLKDQEDRVFFEFGLISALTLLSVYHRYYDTFLLFPGVIIIYLHAMKKAGKINKFIWLGYLLFIMILLTIPGDMTSSLTKKYQVLSESYIWGVIAPLQVWAAVLVVSGLCWLLLKKAVRSAVATQNAIPAGSAQS